MKQKTKAVTVAVVRQEPPVTRHTPPPGLVKRPRKPGRRAAALRSTRTCPREALRNGKGLGPGTCRRAWGWTGKERTLGMALTLTTCRY